MSYSIDFQTLRAANLARLPQFKNSLGGPAHKKDDGSDWLPSQWLQALVGELGEFANVRKKYERGDLTFGQYEAFARKELADVQIYLDLLALRCLDTREGEPNTEGGVDLGQATQDKFNEVSLRVGSNVRILGRRLRFVQT